MSLEELKKTRTSIKSRLTIFHSFLKKIDTDPSKSRELLLRLERSEELLSEYEKVQSQIEAWSDLDIDERTKFEDTIIILRLLF